MSNINRTRTDEHPSYYERDQSREIDNAKQALSRMPNFIEEALANEPYDGLIKSYLAGGNVRLHINGMVSDYADHVIRNALKPGNGPDNVGDALQALLDSYS